MCGRYNGTPLWRQRPEMAAEMFVETQRWLVSLSAIVGSMPDPQNPSWSAEGRYVKSGREVVQQYCTRVPA